MAAFRLYSSLQTFYSNDGTLLAGGYLKFLDAGTTDTKDVFGDKGLSVNNGHQIDLDASGRPEHPIWGSGSYDVELYTSEDVKVGEDLSVEIPGGEATALPALEDGEFLTNDGAVMSWAEIVQVPDPTGNANKILGTDGTTVQWVDRPADGTDGTSDLTAVGLDGKTIRTDTATGTSVGGRTQDVSVTYATAMGGAADFIGITITSATLSSGGTMPTWTFTASSTTGFTVRFTMGEIDDTRSDFDFNAGVAFKYWAIGDAP